ncbi:reverse transcriptase domain-containing protein [Herbaspirillum sp. CAH-3]|uniref:reverse transcriptase domain-containing protein n=1 Tax=Herbaspirillum sp. CAH-3 TaxID=2605746 RepID=UPI0012ACD37C|nr:reverse transcriptase domain-containing protein [Herbaspirillum sp. CAH-3]MRT30444.1 RNA-directed DNA polymerase [Herbaspirillum sp. CAH-3]
MTNAFQKALSTSALHDAWREMLTKSSAASRRTEGVDGTSINDFDQNAMAAIRRLSGELRLGEFQFQRLKPVTIIKPNGKRRVIAIPTVKDRIVQRALVNFLSEKYAYKLANDISYGFIKKRSVKQAALNAVAMRKAHPWVFKTDVTAFFDNIPREKLRAAIERFVKDRSLHGILFQAMECEIEDGRKGVAKKLREQGIIAGQGIRQGMPLSPLFSNLLLHDFDAAIEKKRFSALRYADDLIFFGNDRKECEAAADFCLAELGKLGLSIPALDAPDTKSFISAPKEPTEFLGLELSPNKGTYSLRLSNRQIQSIREDMLSMGSVSHLLSQSITLKKLGSLLVAKSNGFLAAYDLCENINEVRNNLEDIEQKTLRALYTNDLGIDIQKLSRGAKTFLGLR